MQIWGESIPLCGGYCALIRSLVVRLVFLPLKESSHATFSRSASGFFCIFFYHLLTFRLDSSVVFWCNYSQFPRNCFWTTKISGQHLKSPSLSAEVVSAYHLSSFTAVRGILSTKLSLTNKGL
nr:uncharacterized protein LOC118028634 isoform X1 [Populus alba]